MLPAKLFGTLAILQACLALFESRTPSKSIDIYLHGTYFVIGHLPFIWLMALASACFALVYLAASRWVLHPLNNTLGVTHFVFVAAGFVLLFASFSPANRWQFLAFLVGGFCFLVGCAVLTANCAWTAIAVIRAE
jgi:heme/copper-type cytochrome/quinol oxidase subunit 1